MTLLMVHGTEISCHRSVRAAELTGGEPVLCFPGRRSAGLFTDEIDKLVFIFHDIFFQHG
jgi:hypothetical protein